MSNSADFEITKKGVLKQYKGTDTHIVIPAGVKEIGKEAFRANRKIVSIEIPDSVTRIGADAFLFCYELTSASLPSGIEEIGSCAFMYCNKLEGITVPEGCTVGAQAFVGCNKLVDERGLLILQNRVCNYHSEDRTTTVVIPDGIDSIDDEAIGRRRSHLEMSLHCPQWNTSGRAAAYGFAKSVINSNGSAISFRDETGKIVAKVILATEDETEPKDNGAILSIRQENHAFDFAGYDAYWAKLGKNPNKIRVALARIQYPYALSEEMREVYEAFLTKQSLNAGKMLIDEDQAELLAMMAEKNLFSKTSLPKLVDYANQSGKTALTAQLLSSQNTAAQNPAPKKAAKPKSREKALWKKPKAGTHLVGRYLGTETEITFPTEVDGIPIEGIANTAGETPENYKAIRSVVIPEGYTAIGTKAFAGCEKLERITLPASLKTIGTGVFSGCENLKELYIAKEVVLAGSDIFAGAKIPVLVIDTNGWELSGGTFYHCQIDDLVVIGGDFKSKGILFDYWYVNENRNFPKRVWINGNFDCQDIRDHGALAKNIHPLSAFDESMIADEAVRAVVAADKLRPAATGESAELLAKSGEVETIDFPAATFVLSGFNYDNEWSVRNMLEKTGAAVANSVSGKTRYLLIPDGDVVKTSKYKKAVELQEKGKNIAILNLSELKKHIHRYNETLYGAEGADWLEQFRITLENGEVTIDGYTGTGVDVVIPAAIGPYPVTKLAKNCFQPSFSTNNPPEKKMQSIVIPDTITEISSSAFQYCSSLKSVTLPEHLRVIGEYAFANCDELEEILFPEHLTEIGDHAFSSCKNLTRVRIPDSVTAIHSYAFDRCPKLERIRIPAGVTSICAPFTGCDNLVEIVVDKHNPVYDSREGCNAIIETATGTIVSGCKTTVFPADVTIIGENAFGNFHCITDFVVPEGITELQLGAFSGCMEMTSIQLPSTLTKIHPYAFSWCRMLTAIRLPEGLELLGDNAFSNCSALEEVNIPEKITELGEYLFYNCPLKRIFGTAQSLAQEAAKRKHATYLPE